MGKLTLTHKQQALLGFVQQYIATHRQSPLIREIQSACQITSYKSALDRLNTLERKGFIRRLPNKHRGIRLARKPPMLPAALEPSSQPQQAEEEAAGAPA